MGSSLTNTAVQSLADGLFIDGVHDSLANFGIAGHMALGAVILEAMNTVAGLLENNQAIRAFQTAYIVNTRTVDDIDLTGLDCHGTRGSFRNDLDNQVLGAGFTAPPVLAGFHNDLFVNIPADQLVRAGAIDGGGVKAHVIAILIDVVFVQDKSACLGQSIFNSTKSMSQSHDDGVIIGSGNRIDELHILVVTTGMLFVQQAVKGGNNIGGGHLFARGCKFDTLAQVEGPGHIVIAVLPALSQAALELAGIGIDLQQALV